MMGRCYEFCPEMAKFLESSKAGQRPFKAKMYPHSEIKWTMQQEFQDPRAYDIVILPCSSPTDETQPDFELEKFTIDHSPVPVVFVRN